MITCHRRKKFTKHILNDLEIFYLDSCIKKLKPGK